MLVSNPRFRNFGFRLAQSLSVTDAPTLAPAVRRAIAALGITQIVGWGSTYYLLTILAAPIGRELGLSPGETAFGMSVLTLVSAAVGPYAGRLMDMHGAGPVMAAGSCIAAAGLGLLSLAGGAASYYFAWVVIGVSCAMILYPAAFTALTQAAPDQARRAITLLTLPGGLASTVFWPLTAGLLTSLDWRTICLIYAGLNLALCMPLHLFAIPPGGARNALPDAPKVRIAGLPAPLRRRAFTLFATVLALNAMLVVGTLNQFTVFLAGLGHVSDTVLLCSMLFGVSQVSARIVEAATGGGYDPLPGSLVMMTGYVAALAVLGLFSPASWAAIVFAVLFGACNGVFTINRGALVLQLFGSEGYGHMSGKVTVAQGIAGAAAPVLVASVIGTGGGVAGLIFLLGVGLASVVAMAALFSHAGASRGPD